MSPVPRERYQGRPGLRKRETRREASMGDDEGRGVAIPNLDGGMVVRISLLFSLRWNPDGG